MTIRLHAIFVVGVLLLVLSMQPAKADTIHVVAGTDSAMCAAVDASCLPVSFTADFMVTPPTLVGPPAFGFVSNVDFIESMSGTLNGFSAVGGSGGWLMPDNNYRPIFAIINFTADGLPWQIGFDDLITGDTWLGQPTYGGPQFSYLVWNATLVQTPEPSSLMLLLLGTGALLVGLALFKNKPCSY